MNDLYQEDPTSFEDFSDLIAWRESSNEVFYNATRFYFQSKIAESSSDVLLDLLTDKRYSEISLIPNLFNRKFFIDDTYEIAGLFVDNKDDERFFVLKKNHEFYALDVSKEYPFLINKR